MALPQLGDILQTLSPHWQEVVLGECTPIELIRLSVTNRSMRNLSFRLLKRRKCDVRICQGKMWVCDKDGRSSSIEFPIEPNPNRFRREIELEDLEDPGCLRTASMFLQLCRTTRIGHLNAETTLLMDMLIRNNVGYWDLAVDRRTLKSDLKNGQDVFKVDSMDVPYHDNSLRMMKYFLPNKVCLRQYEYGIGWKNSRDSYPPVHMFAYRGMVEADVLEIEEANDGVEYFDVSAARLALPILMNPQINLMEHSKLSNSQIYVLIQQWQSGRRRIVGFNACVSLIDDRPYYREMYSDSLDAFCSDVMSTINDTEEQPYPRDDIIHPSVLAELLECEEFHGAVRREIMAPRSMVICRDEDENELVLVVKPLQNDTIIALGIFERDAVAVAAK